MPLISGSVLAGGRIAVCMAACAYKDLAVLEFSTAGHALFNYGHAKTAGNNANIFTASLKETQIALGDLSPLIAAAVEAAAAGFKYAYLLPSAITAAIGVDNDLLAARAKEESKIEVFTSPIGYDEDAFSALRGFYLACAAFSTPHKAERGTFAVLGAGCSRRERADAEYISNLLCRRLGLKRERGDMFAQWEAGRAAVNVVVSAAAVPAAEALFARCGTPYVLFRPFGKESEEEATALVAKAAGAEYAPEPQEDYEQAMTEFRNICAEAKPAVACYLPEDLLVGVAAFLEKCGAKVRAVCSHRSDLFPSLTPDEFVAGVRREIVVSYDSVCEIVGGVPFAESGARYHLPSPYCLPRVGACGACTLAEALTAIIIK